MFLLYIIVNKEKKRNKIQKKKKKPQCGPKYINHDIHILIIYCNIMFSYMYMNTSLFSRTSATMCDSRKCPYPTEGIKEIIMHTGISRGVLEKSLL